MESIDLFGLREHFNRSRILLCFNGPISRSLIEEIGNALKNYLQADSALPSAAMDVFSAYIEMTQNIRHYALAQGYDEFDSSATIVVARDGEGRYVVQAGNLVHFVARLSAQKVWDALSHWNQTGNHHRIGVAANTPFG